MDSPIRRLIAAATLVNGLLASGNINRNLIDMPAWRHVGPLGWAAFSWHADLGRTAMILYPGEAFAGVILSVAVAAMFRRDRTAPRAAAIQVYAAALLTIGGLLFTIKAAHHAQRETSRERPGRAATRVRWIRIPGLVARRVSVFSVLGKFLGPARVDRRRSDASDVQVVRDG